MFSWKNKKDISILGVKKSILSVAMSDMRSRKPTNITHFHFANFCFVAEYCYMLIGWEKLQQMTF